MIYDTIKDIADKRNVSIRQMETDLHFANGTIRRWNTSLISIPKIKKVANYLHIDPYTLLLVGVDMEKIEDNKQEE